MIADRVLAELGARTWGFDYLRQLLLWYFDYQENRYSVRPPALEVGHVPRNGDEQQMDLATWAAIHGCMRNVRYAHRLVDWHRAYIPQQQLAATWGYPNVFTLRWDMRRIEDRLRREFCERGLLED